MKRSLVIMLFFLLSCSVLFGQVPKTISYQGILTDAAGNPKADGNYELTFSFYESEAGGDPVWSETKTLNISKGLLSTSLGSQTPFGAEVKFDKPYWLGLKVGNEAELSPRIALASTGYSLMSNSTLNVADGIALKSLNGLKDDVTLEGTGGTTINTNGKKITISSSGSGGTGIQGVQNSNNTIDITNPNGPTATVNVKVPLAISGSGEYYTLRGYNTGNGGGIWGETWNPNASGVVGYATSGGWGVYGNSPNGAGVVGTSSVWTGVYGETSTWFGLWGKATGENGKGVLGESATSFGVWGKSPNSAGVVGESENWVGVYGQSTANAGVWGKSTNGYGVYGESVNGMAGFFAGKVGVATLQINGGSDLAEPFEINESTVIEPGSVMVIDELSSGKLKLSTEAYDKKVAGIVSGAGGIKPGITLQQDGILEGDIMVAIGGKVYCMAEAFDGSINPGDLLTTSNIPGYAMKVNDKELSQGAVIGKAMTGLKSGKGLVLVLVNLQ